MAAVLGLSLIHIFLGFFPRGGGALSADYGYSSDDEMMIRCISEQEYMTLRRVGIPEVNDWRVVLSSAG